METKQVDLEKIKNKLAKLMRLYEGAKEINSEGEAQNAAAKIQAILIQYNLEMSDINTEEENKNEVGEESMSYYTYKFIGGDWEFKLMSVICRWNFCQLLFTKRIKQMHVLGEKENIEVVKWLHSVLCRKFVGFGKDKYKVFKETPEYLFDPIGLDTFLRRYLTGCSEGLNTKFYDEDRARRMNEQVLATKITALVVRKNEAIQQFIQDKYPKLKTAKVGGPVKYGSAHRMGYNDGKNVEIHKGLNDSKTTQANKVNLLNK